MTRKKFWASKIVASLLLTVVVGACSGYATCQTDGNAQPPKDITGTWSGTFYPKHKNVAPFTITVLIDRDSGGRLTGSANLDSDCLKGAKLEVTVTGSKVVLAGSDEEGDNITVRGTVDQTGTLLKLTYILNGSATGRCETVDGTGSLAKR